MYIYKQVGKLAAAAMATGLLHACVTTKYKPPVADVPGQYRQVQDTMQAAVVNTSDSGIGVLSYRQFFSEPLLLQLIDSGVAHNYNLQIAVKQIESAAQAFRQAKWGNVPVVSLSVGQASVTRPSDNSLNGIMFPQFLGQSYIADYTTAFNVSWEADIWGKIKSRKDAALAGFLQSQEAARAVQTRLVSDIAQGYYNLLMLDEQMAVTRQSIALFDSSIRVTQLLQSSGAVTVLAVQQLQASKEQATALLPQLEQQTVAQENALSVLTGQQPAAIQRAVKLSLVSLHDSLPIAIPVNMVSHRPDIRQAELGVRQAHAMMNVAKASMYPTLSITAQGGLNTFEASNWFKVPGSLFAMGTGSLIQPLLQNRRLKTQLEQAKITRDQSELQFKQSVLGALGEVADAMVMIAKLKVQETHTVNQVNILEQAVKNASLLYDNGDASYLEVLTAQSNKLQAGLTLASLQRQRLSAEVMLYQSLGGGWK